MRSISLHAYSVEELKVQLEDILEQHFKPTLAIVFASVSQDINQVKSIFQTRNIDVVGGSTAGEIYDDGVYTASVSVLLMDMDKDWYRIRYEETGDRTTYQLAYSIGEYARGTFENPAVIVLSGGMTVDAEQIVFGVKDGVGKEVPFFGGLAGDDLGMNRTYIYSQNEMTDDGLICLVINNDKVEVTGLATSGWEAIGAVNTITKAEGNILHSINNQPALDVFIRYFGFFDNSNSTGEEVLMSTISGQYPLQILREGGYSILRAPLIGNEENRSLVMAGGVKEGDQFRFSISPGFEVIEDTIKEVGIFQKEKPQADALILVSCKGRHAALGPLIEEEIQGIYNYWNTPMIGFFSYGEIGQTKTGVCEFHNETCCLILLREK